MDENQIEISDTTITVPNRNILEKISFALLFLASFLLPIFFVPASFISTQFGTSLLFATAVILTTLLMIISAFGAGSLRLPTNKKYIIWLYALVPVVYILAGVANGFSRMTFLGYTFDISTVGFIVLGFVYMFFVSLLFTEKNRIFYSYLAFVLSAILLALFLILRIVFGVSFLSFGIFTALTSTPIGNWNNVGIFFGIGAILSLLTYEMLSVSKFMKILLLVALLLSLLFLSFVNFGIIWIILSVCSLLFILYGIWSRRKDGFNVPVGWKAKLKSLPLYPSLVFLISVIFVIWGATLSGYFANHFNLTNMDVRPSFGTTMNIAKATLHNQPLFGSGPNSFVSQWLSYKPTEIINTVFWNTDFNYGIGLLPTFVVTTGIFGILSWLVFFCFYIYLGVKALFAKISDDFTKYLVTSSFFISLYLWIMAWVYVPSAVILILTFFFTGLFLASICVAGVFSVSLHSFSYTGTNEQSQEVANGRLQQEGNFGTGAAGFISSLILVGLFVMVSALGFGLFKNSQSLWYFQKSSYALNTQKDAVASEGFMNQAILAMPYDVYYRSLAEIEISRIQTINTQLQAANVTATQKDELNVQATSALGRAVSAGISARDADPSNYLNWIELGRVYESAVPLQVSGAYQYAASAYNEASRRNPQNPGIYLLFAQLDVDQNNLAEAKQYAMAAISAKKDYLDAYYLLAQIEVDQKDLKSAIESVTAATVLSPSDPALLFQLGVLQFNNNDFAGAIVTLQKSLALSPQYANAQYFLGLSYEAEKQHAQAIAQFEALQKTNPDNAQVSAILKALLAGKSIFTTPATTPSTTKATTGALPVQEKQQ
jgi:cytochrome c-type biogenesis protein CcmH/NrfG